MASLETFALEVSSRIKYICRSRSIRFRSILTDNRDLPVTLELRSTGQFRNSMRGKSFKKLIHELISIDGFLHSAINLSCSIHET